MIPLALQERASDARMATRTSLYLAASLYCDGASFPVKIRNISPSGALLESSTGLALGTLVQLVRGSLIVHGLVAWIDGDRCGLKFSGSIDVQQWRMTPTNGEQQRVDEIVRLVKAGAVPLRVSALSCDPQTALDDSGLSADLVRASELLGKLGDRLAKDAIVVAQYSIELQNLDIAMQVVAAVEAILSGKSDVVADRTKILSLRRSANQALSTAA